MGYRERRAAMIAKAAAPHLQPGEQIQTGFLAQTARGIRTTPLGWFVVTDRALLLVSGDSAQRFPRDVELGEPSGLYHTIELDRTYHVHRQYYAEIRAANEALLHLRSRVDPPQQPENEPR